MSGHKGLHSHKASKDTKENHTSFKPLEKNLREKLVPHYNQCTAQSRDLIFRSKSCCQVFKVSVLFLIIH